MEYDRQSEARYEYDGMDVSFRPEPGLVEHTARQDGAATVLLDGLMSTRDTTSTTSAMANWP